LPLRVLLVEDSERLRRTLGTALKHAGYAADVVADGTEGQWMAESVEYDVIVLDVMLPGVDGLSILTRLRQAGRDTHVLLLTAKDAVQDRVRGLRLGADDYLVKPFSLDELLARVEVLVRRRHGNKRPRLRFGDLEIDTAGRRAFRAGRQIDLSPREYSLLHYLALHPGEVVSRTQIEAATYDERAELMSNVVDAAIYALRKKLDHPGLPSIIQTRRGMGYVFYPRDAEGPAQGSPAQGSAAEGSAVSG
jgi:DNA-binding response OmpR family regulator